MADETITAASVLQSANASIIQVTLGATVTQGQSGYKDTSDSNKWKLAQCDGTAIEAGSGGIGIFLTAGASGQKALVCTKDSSFTPGFTATEGTLYVVPRTAGGIASSADLLSTDRVTHLGVGQSDGTIDLDPDASGTTKP